MTTPDHFSTSQLYIIIYFKCMFYKYNKIESYHMNQKLWHHSSCILLLILYSHVKQRQSSHVKLPFSTSLYTYLRVGKCIHTICCCFWSLSILKLLGYKYCKWIIYICTVYNFQVHEMDYQRLIRVLKKRKKTYTIYKKYVSIFLMNCCPLSSLILIPNEVLHQALQIFSTALFERMIVSEYLQII